MRSFGWNAKACNGHKASEIFQSLNFNNTNKPLALIAKTIKGYPISFMSNKPIWHYRSPNKKELSIAKKDLIEKYFADKIFELSKNSKIHVVVADISPAGSIEKFRKNIQKDL